MAEAAALRDAAHGARITYSPKVFIPLTMLCRDKCGYCTFAKPPAHLVSPFLELDEVLAIARRGAELGCHEALFTLGEAPEARYPVAAEWLAARGYASTVDYLVAACAAVLDRDGDAPARQRRCLSQDDLERLRAVSPSQGMMIETLAARLGEPGGPHAGAPDKTPERRLATLEAAGPGRGPVHHGHPRGHRGDPRPSGSMRCSRSGTSHERHGHVQEVIVQNFLPKPGTIMFRHDPCDRDEYLWTIAAARIVLGGAMHLQAPPNLSDADELAALIGAGIDDWGGVSPVTPDHVNPERPWPELDLLRRATEAAGKSLAPRLTVYPEYVRTPERLAPSRRPLPGAVRVGSRRSCPRRPMGCGWQRRSPAAAPRRGCRSGGRLARALRSAKCSTVCSRAAKSTSTRSSPCLAPAAPTSSRSRPWPTSCASRRSATPSPSFATATSTTRTCARSSASSAHSRRVRCHSTCGERPICSTLEEIQRRVLEAVDCGATEVCLQGGIHPDFDGNYYLAVARAVKEVAPQIHVHGFTALEVTEGARRLDMPLRDYLLLAKEAGLATLPGTAAEILDDEVRAIICPDKVDTEQWLDAHRTAHSVGLRSNITIMFGHVERPEHVARHLVRTRAVQKETGGFTEFVPLPFVHMATPIFLQHRARKGPTMREVLLMHAVGRIAYRGWIDNIQVSWVKTGMSGARQALQAGCNDLGGTLMDENISRAAGASHGQELDESELRAIVDPLGRPLEQRTTLYGRIHTEGRRLRPPPEALEAERIAAELTSVPVTIGGVRSSTSS